MSDDKLQNIIDLKINAYEHLQIIVANEWAQLVNIVDIDTKDKLTVELASITNSIRHIIDIFKIYNEKERKTMSDEMTNKINQLRICLENIENYKIVLNNECDKICNSIGVEKHSSIKTCFRRIITYLGDVDDTISEYINNKEVFQYKLQLFYGRSNNPCNKDIFIKTNINYDDFVSIDDFLKQLVDNNVISESDSEWVVAVTAI